MKMKRIGSKKKKRRRRKKRQLGDCNDQDEDFTMGGDSDDNEDDSVIVQCVLQQRTFCNYIQWVKISVTDYQPKNPRPSYAHQLFTRGSVPLDSWGKTKNPLFW